MLSSIFIALLQAVAGDPAVNAPEAPAAEVAAPATTSAPAAAPTPRTERRRVCDSHPAATGGRLQARRCRWEEVPVVEETAPEEEAADTHSNHQGHAGGHASTAPAPETPQQN